MRIRWILPFCFSLLVAAHAGAQEWPRFRGPHGDGVSDGAALPVEFGPRKNLLWRASVPMGRSSPIVLKDRVYLTAVEGDALATLAFDVGTGKTLWRRDIVRDHTHKIYVGNDSATPTPATDGESLYVFFPDFGLVAYDLEGKERWRLALGPFDSFYGLSSSPVVHGDVVALVCDQRSGSFAIAVDNYQGALYLVKNGGVVTTLDPRTGEVLKSGRTPEAIDDYYASPVAGDGKVFLLSHSGKVTVLKADPQWEILAVNSLDETSQATPAIAGGRIYIRTHKALYSFGLGH